MDPIKFGIIATVVIMVVLFVIVTSQASLPKDDVNSTNVEPVLTFLSERNN